MINQKRVRRIKNIIYGFFILLLFLPAVLMVALFFRFINLEKSLDDALAAQMAQDTSRQDSFSLDVENQAARLPAGAAGQKPEPVKALSQEQSQIASPPNAALDPSEPSGEERQPEVKSAMLSLNGEESGSLGDGDSRTEPEIPPDTDPNTNPKSGAPDSWWKRNS